MRMIPSEFNHSIWYGKTQWTSVTDHCTNRQNHSTHKHSYLFPSKINYMKLLMERTIMNHSAKHTVHTFLRKSSQLVEATVSELVESFL